MEKIAYLVRHGQALGGVITLVGREQVRNSAQRIYQDLQKQNLEEITIYHSPLRRTKDSAEEIAKVFNPMKVKLQESEYLRCNRNSVETVVNQLTSPAILVGHQPDLEVYLEKNGQKHIFKPGDFKKVSLP